MAGFVLLRWTPETSPRLIKRATDAARAALRRSHSLSTNVDMTELFDDDMWCAELSSIDSMSSQVIRHSDGSWIFALGSASYNGQRVVDSSLLQILSDVHTNAEATAKRLEGVFTIVACDRPGKRVVIIPSALGQYATFMRVEQGLIAVSSSILALTSLGPVTLDEFACQSLYRCGHRLPPSTMFNEIRSLPEGTFVELSSGGHSVQTYWRAEFNNRVPKTLSAAAESIGSHLSGYCRSLVAAETTVVSDLTGGYDSRVSTACVRRAEIPYVATVAGPANDPDVQLATRICRAEGLPLHVIDPAEDTRTLHGDIDAALLMAEGCIDTFVFATTLRVKRQVMERSGAKPMTTVTGALGECFRDFYWAQELWDRGKFQPPSLDRLIRYRIDATPHRMDFFSRNWHQSWRTSLRGYLEDLIAPYAGERNTSQLDMVYLRKMTGMAGGFSSALSRYTLPLLPFSSTAALDLALSVPLRWRFNSRLFRSIAWSLDPRFASYTTLKGCPCAPLTLSNWHRFLPKYKMEVERAIRKASTVWLGHTLFPEFKPVRPEINPYCAFVQQEMRPGGHLDFNSMRTSDWYAPRAFAGFMNTAQLPGGYLDRGAVSWIYTCEAMARIANAGVTRSLAARAS
jgi:hypothetical protein